MPNKVKLTITVVITVFAACLFRNPGMLEQTILTSQDSLKATKDEGSRNYILPLLIWVFPSKTKEEWDDSSEETD